MKVVKLYFLLWSKSMKEYKNTVTLVHSREGSSLQVHSVPWQQFQQLSIMTQHWVTPWDEGQNVLPQGTIAPRFKCFPAFFASWQLFRRVSPESLHTVSSLFVLMSHISNCTVRPVSFRRDASKI